MKHEIFDPDYSYYFITLIVKYRKNLLGEIKNGKMDLSKTGIIAYILWQEMLINRKFLKKDAFVVMPDHFHGIISINKNQKEIIMKENPELEVRNVLEYAVKNLVWSYKSAVKKYANIFELEFAWQEGYHNEFVCSIKELDNKRNYIYRNVSNWGRK